MMLDVYKRQTEKTVHPGNGIAYRHGIPSVTVITGTDGYEIVFVGLSGCIPVSYTHLLLP